MFSSNIMRQSLLSLCIVGLLVPLCAAAGRRRAKWTLDDLEAKTAKTDRDMRHAWKTPKSDKENVDIRIMTKRNQRERKGALKKIRNAGGNAEQAELVHFIVQRQKDRSRTLAPSSVAKKGDLFPGVAEIGMHFLFREDFVGITRSDDRETIIRKLDAHGITDRKSVTIVARSNPAAKAYMKERKTGGAKKVAKNALDLAKRLDGQHGGGEHMRKFRKQFGALSTKVENEKKSHPWPL